MTKTIYAPPSFKLQHTTPKRHNCTTIFHTRTKIAGYRKKNTKNTQMGTLKLIWDGVDQLQGVSVNKQARVAEARDAKAVEDVRATRPLNFLT